MTVIAHATHHETSNVAYAQARVRRGQQEIDDAVALTIASWWQAPAGKARAFATLASTHKVEYHALADAIHEAYLEAETLDDKLALDMLSTWALAKHHGRLA